MLSICSVGFDAFMLESIVPLLNGKTIVIADGEEQESPKRLAALIRGYAVGILFADPVPPGGFSEGAGVLRSGPSYGRDTLRRRGVSGQPAEEAEKYYGSEAL